MTAIILIADESIFTIWKDDAFRSARWKYTDAYWRLATLAKFDKRTP